MLGLETKSQARTRLGVPTDVHVDVDGREVWEYASGRLGRGTTMVRFRKDGRVDEIRRALEPGNVDRIAPQKSTQADVRGLLGMPADIQVFPSTDSEVWEYRVLDEAGRRMILKVDFDHDGIVRGVARLIEGEGGPGGSQS